MALTVTDIAQRGRVQSRAQIVQRKTGRAVQFEITEQTRLSLERWIGTAGLLSPDYLFPGRVNKSLHLLRRQYARIVDRWVTEIGLDPSLYGTHSLRRTKVSLIYRRTKNLRAIQLLLGHTKMEHETSTRGPSNAPGSWPLAGSRCGMQGPRAGVLLLHRSLWRF
jgi:integrase